MKKVRLNRRTFLRGTLAGTSVAIGLPALEAMTTSRGLFNGSAHGQTAAAPVRILSVMFRNGALMSSWTPSTAGTDYTLPVSLEPLEPFKSQINVVTGLFNPGAEGGAGGGHARGSGSFATGVPNTSTGAGGPSFDQIAAQKLGGETRFRSLAIAPEGYGYGGYDGAADAVKQLSWTDRNTPVPLDSDPVALFDRLFAGGVAPDALAELRARRQSVLDSVVADIERLNARLGASDRKRLDAHLSAVRDLELQTAAVSSGCTLPEPPPDVEEHGVAFLYASEGRVKLMMDLLAQAFACDLTRFGSFSLGLDVSPLMREEFGDTRDHHLVSHDDASRRVPIIEAYTRYEVEVFAHLLARMNAVEEGEHTLLDNSAIYFASEVAHGDMHTHDNLPVILAGSAGGRITTGRHLHLLPGPISPGRRDVTVSSGRSVNELFLTLIHCAGATEVTSFGLDGNSPLELA